MDKGATKIKEDINSIKLKGIEKKHLVAFQKGKIPLALFFSVFGGYKIESSSTEGSSFEILEIENNSSDIETIEILEDESINSDSEYEDVIINDIEDGSLYNIEIPSSITFAHHINNEMSFGEAFKEARSQVGPDGFFNWRGQSYHTHIKEEWDILSDSEKAQIYKNFQKKTDFSEGTYSKQEDSIETIEIYDEADTSDTDNTDEFVELDEIGSTDDILEGLNDGISYGDEDVTPEDV